MDLITLKIWGMKLGEGGSRSVEWAQCLIPATLLAHHVTLGGLLHRSDSHLTSRSDAS